MRSGVMVTPSILLTLLFLVLRYIWCRTTDWGSAWLCCGWFHTCLGWSSSANHVPTVGDFQVILGLMSIPKASNDPVHQTIISKCTRIDSGVLVVFVNQESEEDVEHYPVWLRQTHVRRLSWNHRERIVRYYWIWSHTSLHSSPFVCNRRECGTLLKALEKWRKVALISRLVVVNTFNEIVDKKIKLGVLEDLVWYLCQS